MYNQKFVVAIKSNGKVLREDKDIVMLPFGHEYSVFMKNLHSQRAVVSISIDGNDVLDGKQLVIDGNSELNLERFLGGEGRKFKFIERTQDIENHRGVGIQDGLIRVEFQFEKYKAPYVPYVAPYKNPWENPWDDSKWAAPRQPYYPPIWCSTTTYSSSEPTKVPLSNSSMRGGLDVQNCSVGSSYSANIGPTMDSCLNDLKNDAGITVEGSKSYQNFTTVSVGELEPEKHVIVLQLKGVDGEIKVAKPVTVKTNKYCPSCGREWPYRHEYCPKDGTFLKLR